MLQFNVKRIMSLLLAAFLALTVSPVVHASDVSAQNAQDTICEYIEALDNNDWDKIITLSPDCDYQENVSFYYSEENAENDVGFHTITSAKLVTAIELDNKDLYDYTNAGYYFDTYNALKLYLVGVDMLANKESKYFYNGVNFFLTTLGQENGVWKVVLFSQAPATVIESAMAISAPISNDGSYMNSADIEKALKIIRSRYEGLILGSEGSVIETNIASNAQLAEEKGLDVNNSYNLFDTPDTTASTDDHARPSTIAVYMTSTRKVKDVEFYDYCKGVLPNEWYSTWNEESLKAGAQAVKFVGWYRVYNAKYPGKGYDVKDSDADQVYKAGSEVSSCTSAINAVGGIGMENSDHEIFYPAYGRGVSGEAGEQYSGKLSQYGSQYLAKQESYTYDEILDYYYSFSGVSTDAITTFSY